MAAAHAHGLVHRDLKPENVMGRREETGSLSVKILDLGLVKFQVGDDRLSATMTAEGAVMGTPAYMSPEQLAGRTVDHRTDVYAMGVMVAEALTGRRPGAGASGAQPADAVSLHGHRLPGFPADSHALGEVLQRCLAVDPAARIGAAALLRDLLIPLVGRASPIDPRST